MLTKLLVAVVSIIAFSIPVSGQKDRSTDAAAIKAHIESIS